jgi:hypothetical protein
MTKDEVERLLRHGAYDIFNEDKAGTAEAESNNFIEQDIDSILERRSRTVVHDNTGSASNAAGGTFSKASFIAPKTPTGGSKNQPTEDIDIEDPDFWTKMVGEAPAEIESELKPRKRNTTNYSERYLEQQLHAHIALEPDASGISDSDSDESASSEDEEEAETTERARWGGQKPHHWKRGQAEGLLKTMERYGYGVLPLESFMAKLPSVCKKFSQPDVHRMSWSLVLLALCEVAKEDASGAKKRAERNAERKRESADNADALAESLTSVSSINEVQIMQTAFKKVLKANSNWVQRAFADAVSYARVNQPRSSKALEQGDKVDEMTSLFYGSLWPSLKGRGWKEQETETGKAFTYDTYRVSKQPPPPNSPPPLTNFLRFLFHL